MTGRCAMTADSAIRLGFWLGTGPDIWMNLQKSYELRLTELEMGEEIRRTVVPISSSSEDGSEQPERASA